MKKILILLTIFFIIITLSSYSSTCTAIASGNWGSASTWDCGHVPICPDNITIPNGFTVTVNVSPTYTCSIVITVSGVLQFQNGKKIDLQNSSSTINITSTGSILSGGGGGSSNLIDIGGVNVWKSSEGPITGPTTMTPSWALPIELISFTGEEIDDYNFLKWITASEINNDFFTIEKSLDGINFEPLNNIDGAGNSTSILHYSLTDNLPYEITYYRLRQTDFNGIFKDSEIIAVTRSNNGENLEVLRICNLMGQDVTDDYDGIKVYYFNDGSIVKKYKIIER